MGEEAIAKSGLNHGFGVEMASDDIPSPPRIGSMRHHKAALRIGDRSTMAHDQANLNRNFDAKKVDTLEKELAHDSVAEKAWQPDERTSGSGRNVHDDPTLLMQVELTEGDIEYKVMMTMKLIFFDDIMKKMNPPIIYLKMSLKAMQISTF
jgi:hypothetical protein